jgi:hypothetical protein
MPPLVERAGRYLTRLPVDRDVHAMTDSADLPRGGMQRMARIALLAALVVSAAGCGGDKPDVAAGPTLSEDEVKQKCADPQWRDKNFGIWYAVCRQPAGW